MNGTGRAGLGEMGTILSGMSNKGLTDEVTFEQRLEESECELAKREVRKEHSSQRILQVKALMR